MNKPYELTNNELPDVVMPKCPPRNLLRGQKALVTGANSGIGRSVALHLAKEGADVAVNYLFDEQSAIDVVKEIERKGGKAIAIKADISKEDQIKSMFAQMFDELGTIDILVNNAGIQSDAAFDDMTLEQWNKVLGINLTGQFLCAREAIREFKRRGVVREISCAAGKIISMSSVHEVIPWAGHVNYAASKGGVCRVRQMIVPRRLKWSTPFVHISVNIWMKIRCFIANSANG